MARLPPPLLVIVREKTTLDKGTETGGHAPPARTTLGTGCTAFLTNDRAAQAVNKLENRFGYRFE